MRAFPADVVVEPVSYCNLMCPHCPQRWVVDHRSQGVMSLETFDRVVDEVRLVSDTRLWIGFMGEPLLRPGLLFEMVDRAVQAGCRVHLSTNGTLMTPDAAAWLMESGIEEIIVGGYGQKSEAAVVQLLNRRLPGDPRVVIQLIEPAANEGRIASWTKAGATVKVRQRCSWGGTVISTIKPPEKRTPCQWLARCAIVLWDGRYAMCDGDWRGEHAVSAPSISEAWNNSKHALVRELQEQGVYTHPLCDKCDDWAVARAKWYYANQADKRPEDA